MSKKDYYEVLGVSKNSSADEIKKAYRKVAMQHHPDRNPGDKESEQKFKEAAEAYEILSDSDKKSRYDQYGHAGVDPQYGFGGGGGFSDFGDIFGGGGGVGDIFEAFFGGGRRRGSPQGPQRGSDLRLDLEIEFKEAIFGIEKEVSIRHQENCEVCSGNGATPGTKITSCTTCGGSGQVQQTQKTLFGTFTQVGVCPKCNGEGKWPEEPCKPCNGKGKVSKEKKIKIKIPAGVDTGAKIRISGEGDIGTRGGGPGDLYVVIHAENDETGTFQRNGNDVYMELPLAYHQVALGDEIEITTLDATAKLDIPAGTQPGKVFTLKGKGVPVLGTDGRRRGDLHVLVNISVPKKLSDEERKLLKELAALHDPEAAKEKQSSDNGFFSMLKHAFHLDK